MFKQAFKIIDDVLWKEIGSITELTTPGEPRCINLLLVICDTAMKEATYRVAGPSSWK